MNTLYIAIPLLLFILRTQYFNWKTYRSEGNGANAQRVALMVDTIAMLGVCAGLIVKAPTFIAWCVFIMPCAGVVVYWDAIKQLFANFLSGVKNLLKKP